MTLTTTDISGTPVGSVDITTTWGYGVDPKNQIITVVTWDYSNVRGDAGQMLAALGYVEGKFVTDGSGTWSFKRLDTFSYEGMSTTTITAGSQNNCAVNAKWIVHCGSKDPTFANSVESTHHMPVTRCDTIVTTTVGCVLPWVPAYLDVTRNPTATSAYSDHVLSAVTSGLPGGYGTTTYLHRPSNTAAVNQNRATACPKSITSHNPGTDAHPLDCDEYPFARTHEGASTAQFPGEARSFTSINCQLPDLARTGLLGFSRCFVSSSDNQLDGAYYGSFLHAERLIDPDDSNSPHPDPDTTDRFQVGQKATS